MAQPPEPGEPLIGVGVVREPVRAQSSIELFSAISRPSELETREDAGKFAKISPVGALVGSRTRLHLELATGHGLDGNLGQFDNLMIQMVSACVERVVVHIRFRRFQYRLKRAS